MAGKKDRIFRINSQEKPLPKAFVDWMDRHMPRYIIYEAGKKTGTCTGCGKTSEFTKLKYNQKVTCPACKKTAVAKTKKKIKGKNIARKYVYIQKIKNGIMARFIERIYGFDENGCVEKGWDETLRAAVEKGRRQYWYEKRFQYGYRYYDDWKENKIKWCIKTENNPFRHIKGWGGWGPTYEHLPEPLIYGKNKRGIIQDSLLRFFPAQAEELISAINEKSKYRLSICGFLDVYEKIHQYPCLEALYKCDMQEVVEEFICNPQLKLKKKERKPHKILGLRKEIFREMRKREDIVQEYVNRACALQKLTNDTELILLLVEKLELRDIDLFFAENRMPFKKTASYIGKLNCVERNIYRDYIHMASNMGSDMKNTFVLFPWDLEAAHDALLDERDEERKKKEREKAKSKDAAIERVYKRIKKKFSYEDEKYILRPAKTNTEIVLEGQTQHICVGYGLYAEKMMKGTSYILFLRKKEFPEKPYYTVEISPNYDIIQRHGKYNKEGKEKEEIDAFLEKFRKEIGHVRIDYAG